MLVFPGSSIIDSSDKATTNMEKIETTMVDANFGCNFHMNSRE